MNLIQASQAHARGEIDFEQFERHTGKVWSWWARRLAGSFVPMSKNGKSPPRREMTFGCLRRSDVPPWFDEEDARQELLIAAWRAAGRWEEAKGAKPATWIAQSAIRAARKSVMRARGVNRHTWRWDEPARHDVATEDLEAHVDASQEDALMAREMTLAVLSEHGPIAAIVVQALSESDGDPVIAGGLLYADPKLRLLCRLSNEAQGHRLARQWIGALCARRRKR